MKQYKVGGAVRDRLLGRDVKEVDWVVVGATPKDMLRQGFTQVGKAFPVFLHPKTKEEYALARTEQKIGPGYTGFTCYAAPNVTLEDDLKRRDLTINAMAETHEGKIIDPYNGQTDLANRVLRHVSPAFAEDPVRILRLARFAARYADYGFTVAQETQELMETMVQTGEVSHLVPERVWQEFYKALGEVKPSAFLQVLKDCGALSVVFSEVELDHQALMRVDAAATGSELPRVRFAALLQGEDERAVKNFCKRLRVPRDCKDLASLVCGYHEIYYQGSQLEASAIVTFFERLDAFRREERFEEFLLACESGTGKRESVFFRDALNIAKNISLDNILQSGITGPQVAQMIRQQRVEKVKQHMAK